MIRIPAMAASSLHDVSATELELKRRGRRRLIGAITIGLLAFVFLPMIFDSEPKRSGQTTKPQNISVLIPAKEGQPALAAPSAAPPASVTTPVNNTEASPADPGPVKPGAGEAAKVAMLPPEPVVAASESVKPAKKADKPEKNPKAEVSAVPAAKSGFVVQLGVFADADNAKLAVAKVKEAKLVVYTESIPIKTGNATRVRVGPFSTREKADAALAQVKLAGADGKIVPLK
jgi:DedD protein